MKLTNNAKAQLKPGMTLIELTVVIIVLLTLISVLFFAGTAYVKSSNRTGCLANQSNIQKGIRGYQNLNNGKEGATYTLSAVVDDDLLPALATGPGAPGLSCPSAAAAYQIDTTYRPVGTKMVFCTDTDYGDDEAVPTGGTTPNGGIETTGGTGDSAHAPTDVSAW